MCDRVTIESCTLCGITTRWSDVDSTPLENIYYNPSLWDQHHIETVQRLRLSDGLPTSYGYPDYSRGWYQKPNSEGDPLEKGVGFHAACLSILLDKLAVKVVEWTGSSSSSRNDPGLLPRFLKPFVNWMYANLHRSGPRDDELSVHGLRILDYGDYKAVTRWRWGMNDSEKWLVANPLLHPPLHLFADGSSGGSKEAYNPYPSTSTKELHESIHQSVLINSIPHCQGFYRRVGAPKSPSSGPLQIAIDGFSCPVLFTDVRPMTGGFFTHAPNEIILAIFGFLDAAAVCAHFEHRDHFIFDFALQMFKMGICKQSAKHTLTDESGVAVHQNKGLWMYYALAIRGNATAARILLRYGAHIPVAEDETTTLLHMVAKQGWLSCIHFLIHEAKVPVDIRDSTGNTPLHIAAQTKFFGDRRSNRTWSKEDKQKRAFTRSPVRCLINTALKNRMGVKSHIVSYGDLKHYLIDLLRSSRAIDYNQFLYTVISAELIPIFGNCFRQNIHLVAENLAPGRVEFFDEEEGKTAMPAHVILLLIELGADVNAVNADQSLNLNFDE